MTIKDESKVDEILEALQRLEDGYVEIGILQDDAKAKHGDSTVGQIATVHEWGYMGPDKNGRRMNIPERSFIRASYDKHENDLIRLGDSYIEDVVDLKMDPDDVLEAMGKQGATYIQRHIRSMSSPPLKRATIQAKGSSSLLIDTGRLIGAIDFEVK